MSAKVTSPTEVPFARQAASRSPKSVLAKWLAEVLEKGQSLRFLESVGGL
ncbi:MAG TPA: hypothetical protein VF502_17070 [Stellaceae bacterium]